MAERKTYKEIVRKFLENDEVVIETRLDGERAGEKKIQHSHGVFSVSHIAPRFYVSLSMV